MVTGAASGIGRAIAHRFANNGDHVIGIDRQLISDEGPKLCRKHVCDAGSAVEMRSVLEDMKVDIGPPHVMVSCAGYALQGLIDELEVEEWDALMGVNLRGPFLMAKYGIPMMREAGGGIIINVASQLGLTAARAMPAYCASKGGVIQLSRALALDHAQDNVRVHALCPGPTDTPAVQAVLQSAADPSAAGELLMGRTAFGRFIHPLEVANVTFFLASPEASGMTGAPILVDGGYLTS